MVETCLKALSHKGRLLEISAPPQDSRVSFDLRDFYHRQARLLMLIAARWMSVLVIPFSKRSPLALNRTIFVC
jgi:hypothetical protein